MSDADIIVRDTPMRTVTDATGHFRLLNLAPGEYQLQIDGRQAVNGPFTMVTQNFSVTTDEETVLAPVTLEMMTD